MDNAYEQIVKLRSQNNRLVEKGLELNEDLFSERMKNLELERKVEKLQKEIERLETVEKAYRALKSAL